MWQHSQDSNLNLTVLETVVLPVKLECYVKAMTRLELVTAAEVIGLALYRLRYMA